MTLGTLRPAPDVRAERVRLRDRLVDLGFALGWATVRALPEGFVLLVFDRLGALVYRRNRRGVRRFRANLSRVLGPDAPPAELERVTRDGVRSYLRYWCEVFRLPSLGGAGATRRFHSVDEHYLRDSYAEGHGMILALPHMGNWDHAGAWLADTGIPFTTVAERLRPERLFDRFVAFRESIGMEVIPLTGGERPPTEILADRLRSGGCLCLLADRDLTASGIPVRFFGATARMPGGPARLALDTGARLVPVTLWYDGPRTLMAHIHPPIDPPANGTRAERVAAMTQRLADAFAVDIAAHPTDWHMLQRVWPDSDGS